MQLRTWQDNFLKTIKAKAHSVIVAPPGTGKSLLAAHAGMHWLETGAVDHIVYFAPQRQVQRTIQRDWTHQLGLRTYTKMQAAHPGALDYDATALCYQALNDKTVHHILWWMQNSRVALILDEFHHLGDQQRWGSQFQLLYEGCARSLMMSGTAFRTDGKRIAGVSYSDNGEVVPDAHLKLEDAVVSRYVRRINGQQLDVDPDTGLTFLRGRDELHFDSLKDVPDHLTAAAGRTVLDSETYISSFVSKVNDYVVGLRSTPGYEDAGVLWVCPPKERDGDRYLHRIRDVVANVCGDAVAVSAEDEASQGKIDRFREDPAQVNLCAVRMVSEGVDIKRLRVMALMTWPESELLLRQLAGRIARMQETDYGENPLPATIFYMPFPRLSDMIGSLLDETNLPTARLDRAVIPVDVTGGGVGKSPIPVVGLEAGKAILGEGNTNEGARVGSEFVGRADRIKVADPVGTRCFDRVDIGFILQCDAKYSAGVEQKDPTPAQVLGNKGREIDRLVAKLGRLYAEKANCGMPLGKGISHAWIEVHQRFHVRSADEMKQTFSEPRLDQVCAYLRDRIRKEVVR